MKLEYPRELFLGTWSGDLSCCKPDIESARSRVNEGFYILFTQGKFSSISIGGSISSEGFLSSILLSVVIIVMVVFVVVILIVVVVDDVSLILKLSFGDSLFLDRIYIYYLILLIFWAMLMASSNVLKASKRVSFPLILLGNDLKVKFHDL
ncbi:hypothetical protein Tco_0751721 [Tanacetum coccineum]|uniref:Uncharacterized protein n=1 Tax=Tanacetum coccineum TaxID=301880 RepID=A0ABQ4Z7Y4_9ASTR